VLSAMQQAAEAHFDAIVHGSSDTPVTSD
jgi:hypothetical protein